MAAGNRYSRERLAEAAAQCTDIDEVVAFLGTRPYGRLRRYLLARFDHFDIDVTHFPRRTRQRGGPRPEPAELRASVVDSVSVAQVLRRLGRPDSEGQRTLLRAWIAEEGLSTEHFLGQAHQRGRPSPTPAKTAEEILRLHESDRRTKTTQLRRALREIGVPERCDTCGTGPIWHGRPMTLEIDHVNGDWHDNRAANLRLLCPNCHAVTTTWCRGGRRRGSGRGSDNPERPGGPGK
jgi:hypothetical protein